MARRRSTKPKSTRRPGLAISPHGSLRLVIVAVVLCGLGLAWWFHSRPPQDGRMLASHDPSRAALLDPVNCAECHQNEVADWQRSHHALANRLIDFSTDSLAFQLGGGPDRGVDLGSRRVIPALRGDELTLREQGDSAAPVGRVVGVIGEVPLRQYLVDAGRGKFQAYSTAWDPARREWFYVFGNDPAQLREPGEWGHWSGQGMNWNSNCAFCHMTEFKKNLVPGSEPEIAYQSTWLHQSITCAQCHTGLDDHVRYPEAPFDSRLATPALEQESCASCHARREELSADQFRPGDRFLDHYHPALADQGTLYHPDGQVNDENFVYSSMLFNRMGHAGISCLDCHNPHSAELVLPAENNALCLQCHASGERGASIIDPVAHSHHAPGSTGGRCIECHMPVNTFMARDHRRDHIFSSPDPVLSQELGSPVTCTACHKDQSIEWAAEHTDRWWPRPKDHRTRTRARAIQRARRGDADAYKDLIALAKSEEIAAWRASLTGLLQPWAHMTEAELFLRSALDDPEPLVRAAAVRAMQHHPNAARLLASARTDSFRAVRLQAARVIGPDPAYRDEFDAYLRANSDRPATALLRASLAGNDTKALVSWIQRAIHLEPSGEAIFADGSVLLARAGMAEESETLLKQGILAVPGSAVLPYQLALLDAERGDLQGARKRLNESLSINPRQARAWYNLSIIEARLGRNHAAREAALRAYEEDPGALDIRAWAERLNLGTE